jgi:hypothetical protein
LQHGEVGHGAVSVQMWVRAALKNVEISSSVSASPSHPSSV